MKAAVIGHPVRHSLSPLIHCHWMAQYDLSGSYEAIDIEPCGLREGVQRLIDEGYKGFNVTLPHKCAVMDLCDNIDETAQRIGAVNMVTIDDQGHLHGSNTDAYGFIENLKQHDPGFDFSRCKALVLGAGGAARAVIQGLKDQGVSNITVTNRTESKAEKLAADFAIDMTGWEKRECLNTDIDLLINTTSLGMKGWPPLNFDFGGLRNDVLICDIVYNPLMTEFLTSAQKKGHNIVTGIGMLLHQARPAFNEWFGVMPDVTEALETKIMEMLS